MGGASSEEGEQQRRPRDHSAAPARRGIDEGRSSSTKRATVIGGREMSGGRWHRRDGRCCSGRRGTEEECNGSAAWATAIGGAAVRERYSAGAGTGASAGQRGTEERRNAPSVSATAISRASVTGERSARRRDRHCGTGRRAPRRGATVPWRLQRRWAGGGERRHIGASGRGATAPGRGHRAERAAALPEKRSSAAGTGATALVRRNLAERAAALPQGYRQGSRIPPQG